MVILGEIFAFIWILKGVTLLCGFINIHRFFGFLKTFSLCFWPLKRNVSLELNDIIQRSKTWSVPLRRPLSCEETDKQGEIVFMIGHTQSAEECVKSNPSCWGQRHFLEKVTSEIHCKG